VRDSLPGVVSEIDLLTVLGDAEIATRRDDRVNKNDYEIPTTSGNMVKVDSKGRIVLPQEIRERLGITPGSEVEIREEGGKAVVEPEDDPDQVIDRMDQLIEEASANRDRTIPIDGKLHPLAQKHADTIRRGAQGAEDE
jgi:AbrB family looped-hinge helix DNA binding protein